MGGNISIIAPKYLQRVDYKSLFLLTTFYRHRLAIPAQPPLAFYISDRPDICNTGTGLWRRLPPIPTNTRWPVLYRIAGALWPRLLYRRQPRPFVHVYDLLTNTWHSGRLPPPSTVGVHLRVWRGRTILRRGRHRRLKDSRLRHAVRRGRGQVGAASRHGPSSRVLVLPRVTPWLERGGGLLTPGFSLDASNGIQVDKLESLVKEGKSGRLACNLRPEFESCSCLLHWKGGRVLGNRYSDENNIIYVVALEPDGQSLYWKLPSDYRRRILSARSLQL